MVDPRYLLLAPVVLASTAQAQTVTVETRVADVVSVLQGQQAAEAVFDPTFLAAVPASQLQALIAGMVKEHGALIGAEEIAPGERGAARFMLRFERARANASLHIAETGPRRVIGLHITSVIPLDESPAKLLEDFIALPGETGFTLVRLGQKSPVPVLSHSPAQQFAIGSTFKLWVLDAVAEEVAAKRLRWDQVVQLDERSQPSGIMQDWPKDAPVTVETLATLMISISDNTATDTLMRLVGRDKIAARVIASGHSNPEAMLPMLTTREAFALKTRPAPEIAAYGTATRAGRAALLDRLEPTPAPSSPDRPLDISTAEWFAAPDDIARILDTLRRRPDQRVLAILQVAPSLTPELKERFLKVGYKGGSEPGVLNLSWLLQSKRGDWYVATASWNDPEKPLDQARFEQLALRLISLVR